MDKTQTATTVSKQQEETITYAGFHSIITGINRSWEYGGFQLPDGTFWRYREPNAVIVVEGERSLCGRCLGEHRRGVIAKGCIRMHLLHQLREVGCGIDLAECVVKGDERVLDGALSFDRDQFGH